MDKDFPKNSPLAKVFNRSTVKISYSCTGNMSNIVETQCENIRGRKSWRSKEKPCNCRDKNNCPLSRECQAEGIVYSAEVSDGTGFKRTYIGYTEGPFKKSFYKHTTSFRLESHRSDTKLADCIWRLRELNGRNPCVKWGIIKKVKPGRIRGNCCRLCQGEVGYRYKS